MPPDENIHQENHFSQDAERPNSLLFELRKEKDFNSYPYLEDLTQVYNSYL